MAYLADLIRVINIFWWFFCNLDENKISRRELKARPCILQVLADWSKPLPLEMTINHTLCRLGLSYKKVFWIKILCSITSH